MKVNRENTLNALKNQLHRRLERVIDHLHQTSWPSTNVLGHTGRTNDEHPPWGRSRTSQSEETLMRFEAYSWSRQQLAEQDNIPASIFEMLSDIEDHASELVTGAVDTISMCVDGLVEKNLRNAVLSRTRLVSEWPWPLDTRSGAFLHLLLALCPSNPPDERLFTQWPLYTASATVAEWAEPWLRKNAHPDNADVVELMKQTSRNKPVVFALRPRLPSAMMATPALALLYLVEAEVKEDQQRKFIAIDTCKEHTKLMEAWRDLPKSKRVSHRTALKRGRLELILPDASEKRHFQLSLDFADQPVASQIATVLREWRSWAGLRHWVAFQSQITSNQRLGWVRWTVDEHLKAMGLRKEWRRRLKTRRAAAEMVDLFTKIEIALYDEKGNIRERRPLVLKGNTYERLRGSQWEIEGLELKVNPMLYRGVRDATTGKIGKNWWPTPKELAHIDHNKHGPAIALGTILPARWRMELGQSNKTYIDLKGDSLLRASGLPYRQQDVVATWRSVERNLNELQRRGGLESWHWEGTPDLATVCRLHAPQWAVDRIAHGVPPKEKKPAPTALTGAELKGWRTRSKLTQAQAAALLGVATRTVRRAEATPDKALSKKVREALSQQDEQLTQGKK